MGTDLLQTKRGGRRSGSGLGGGGGARLPVRVEGVLILDEGNGGELLAKLFQHDETLH